jgi:sarcosine oxidase subunit alpha
MNPLGRIPGASRIDPARSVQFTFDGREYRGFAGDTLASALLANGVRLLGRSFKYHRPRGIVADGSQEPNALVTIGEAGLAEPNARATEVEIYEGLIARSQNAWPSLAFDLGAINGLLAPVLSAGFYYKTFLGSARLWTQLYEPFIRRAAGLGPAPTEPDPECYDKLHVHCDVLIVGGGPAGVTAALQAGKDDLDVILIDEKPCLGGLSDLYAGSGEQADLTQAITQLSNLPNVRVLVRTTAFGRYEDGLMMASERLSDHLSPSHRSGPRQRLWQIRAGQTILAAGAHEQPTVFHNNDLPGVMLTSAALGFLKRYGVLVGRRIVIGCGDDSAFEAARQLAEAGAQVTVVDIRAEGPEGAGFEVLRGGAILAARGRRQVRGAIIESRGIRRTIGCDALLMAGGWQPALHLHSHLGGKAVFDPGKQCFVPILRAGQPVAIGSCAGELDHRACIDSAGRTTATLPKPSRSRSYAPAMIPPHSGAAFVDYQNDVKLSDIDLASREGFVSVEHLKRYTTTGMATDQGKLSNLNALRRLADNLRLSPPQVGTTTFRPPFTPVTLGTIAGLDRGRFIDPERHTPMHAWHVRNGAVFENVGQWKRPHYYPGAEEGMDAAVRRECEAVRERVGMLDASTLGKIDIQGRDAARFLELVYTNAWLKLEVGRCRYGVMCHEDGMVFDDGVTARLGDQRYLMTTTTGNAARVLDHLEDYLQTEWPHLEVYLTSVTDHWAATVVTGPKARDVLSRVVEGIDLSNTAFPHLCVREGQLANNIPARLYRISFTGELSFEVHVPARHGAAAWELIHEAGAPFGITPYGTETMHVLRAEKGYIIIGQETDGTVNPIDLGLGWAIGKNKPDWIGKRSLARPDMLRPDRKQLVGLLPLDRQTVIEEGAQLTHTDALQRRTIPMLGHVTSSYWSMALGAPFALALLKGGRARYGETVIARFGEDAVACKVCSPVFVDPDGTRMNG